ncbi:lipopolysaccharide/colanic/teichoic acid biosynthesis glycosyltransferase [Haloarcula quadrata]|uniref:Lipopolysaccharide/colanic/teichoic acid biosynthesis glycosyltransferase n=1 Tax=Haloarcula quadrata TaxID=182779 RepID=A0A495R7G3_9EURY|nr:sugar transferase [Haloarcula quadrata]RKS83247.1 lipopolysaccharide/colanic/teichoic acid biosynthesis glycosyltransferase [Haloarcula quadrata]
MDSGWRYRVASVAGVAVLTAVAITLINNATIQSTATTIPIFDRLPTDPPTGSEFTFELLVTIAVVVSVFLPLYKPRPRRILDTVVLAQKRVLVAVLVLATIGYFDYTYRLPRLTVVLVTPLLLLALPAWFVWIRKRPSSNGERILVVGDDLQVIEEVASAVDGTLLGYLCPTSVVTTTERTEAIADGGLSANGLERLGGLSRIEDVLVEYDIDTVVLAFEHADRAEFFGALDACYEYGVGAKVHRNHTDSVLTASDEVGTLVDVEIEPWDIQDYILKRAFDIVFATVGLVVLSPVIVGIAVAIKMDDGGPILYTQERTAVFGEAFNIYKFRSMAPGGESATPVEDEKNNRITAVGKVLRRTHLDETPQLWSILVGDMSVVGPRAVWTAEESLLEADTQSWRQRWFVKPGLTGLAQVNNIESTNPSEKLRLDLKYIRKQSFSFDVKLVIRQIWKVLGDILTAVQTAILR